MSDNIHIVCLDAPAPPDYGGAIDMFYKVKALHRIGKKITLHYYNYHPQRNADALKEYCTAIYEYSRKSFWQSLPLSRPFIVQSRINQNLVERLNKDNHPILLEGLHCSGLIPFLENKERVIVRMHNEEASYYHHLAKTESSFLKRCYFSQEKKLIKAYQKKLDKDIQLACLSETDMEIFNKGYGFHHLSFIPCFLPWQQITSPEGKGEFCLYHGNLSVSENEEAAIWLIENVFSKTEVPFVIAGKGVSKKLLATGASHATISFVNNPSIAEIDRLVQEAQINVLPSLNNTGVKLKLLNALLNGRHCITNTNGIKGSRIHKGVFVKDDAPAWIGTINLLMQQDFSAADREDRRAVLRLYNNKENAEQLSALWSHCQ